MEKKQARKTSCSKQRTPPCNGADQGWGSKADAKQYGDIAAALNSNRKKGGRRFEGAGWVDDPVDGVRLSPERAGWGREGAWPDPAKLPVQDG